jgi:dUTP pyrophosphatase
MIAKFKKVHPAAQIPVYKTSGAAGCDITCVESIDIKPGAVGMVRTGLAIEPPVGYFLLIAPRGSLCLKMHLHMPNSVAIGDADFRGEYLIPLRNAGQQTITIPQNERIAQIVFLPYQQLEFLEVSYLSESERGSGAFGSTGKF